LVALLLVALLGVGIVVAVGGGTGGGDALADTSWTLTDLGGTALAPDAPATLRFTATEVAGTSGCNTFGGTYMTGGDAISFGALAANAIGCPGPVMTQEQAYFAALDAAQVYAVEGDTLTLRGPSRSISFARS
jgi:heat shock protein HslJ